MESTSAENSLVLKELAKLNGKMSELECKVNSICSGSGGGQGNNDSDKPKFIKCTPCQKEGRFCKHCSLCGKGGHKRRDCKEAATENE